jgi:hypothetical protein
VTLRKVSLEQRDRAFIIWEEIERRIGGWARGQMTLCLVIGVISTFAYLGLGLKYWLALGLWAGFTELIPFIGPILGGAAAFAVALTDSWQKALVVLAFVVVLQQLESAVLVPRVMRSSVGMSPLTVVLAVLVGSTLSGPLGAILAIPIGAAVQAIVQEAGRSGRSRLGVLCVGNFAKQFVGGRCTRSPKDDFAVLANDNHRSRDAVLVRFHCVIRAGHLEVAIHEQIERNIELVQKDLVTLRFGFIDSVWLSVERAELFHDLSGFRQLGKAAAGAILRIEKEHRPFFAPEIAQPQAGASRAGEVEVGRGIANIGGIRLLELAPKRHKCLLRGKS